MALFARAPISLLLILTLLTLFHPWVGHAADWEHLEDCVIVPSSLNDGDSFLIRTGAGRELVVRLYFIDCAESSNLFPDRVRDQARYFGSSTKRVIELGAIASSFIESYLRGKTFSLYTMWEDGWGQAKRSLGIVVVGEETLSEVLVKNGLARIHGFRPDSAWPGGVRSDIHLNRLRIAEKEAKRRQVGGWGEQNPIVNGTKITKTTSVTQSEVAPSSNLVNLNEATQKELRTLPEVGEVLARRIEEGRPWYEVEDLRRVDGIGDYKMLVLKPLVTVISSTAPENSADYFRKDPNTYLNQTVTVSILNVKEVTWPAPDGFSVVQAFTGSSEKFGGAIPLFFPEEKREQVLAFYARESIGQTQAVFYSYKGKPVLVKPRERSAEDSPSDQ